MFTTADSTSRAALGPLRPAPLSATRLAPFVALMLIAAQANVSAQPGVRTGRGGASSRKSAARLPRYEDYPARSSFTGRPASVRLRTRRDRNFRTRLREGAAEGPNFAGSYTVVYWGCGTGCAQLAVVDAKTGLVYWPPLRYADIPTPEDGEYGRGYEYGAGYRRDSRLLVLTDTHYDSRGSYTAYFYLFNGRGFRLLRKAVLTARLEGEDAPPPNDPIDPK